MPAFRPRGPKLAVIIRTGSRECTSLELARQLLQLDGREGLSGLLSHSLADFCRIKGIGKAKGAQLLCVGELSRRIWNSRVRKGPLSFHDPGEVAEYYMEDMRHLNTKQDLIRERLISRGTLNSSVITPRELLTEALGCLAVGMILVHNHPSGDITPSKADILITERVQQAGEIVGIHLIDHIIIGDRRFFSFRQQKII